MLPQLVNLPRARALMERAGVDALVAQLPINVYYLTGDWGFLASTERFDAANFAVLPRRADSPASYVLPSLELRRLASEGGIWMPQLNAYTSPLADDPTAEAGRPYAGWPVRPGAPLTDRERAWVEIVTQHRDRVAASAPCPGTGGTRCRPRWSAPDHRRPSRRGLARSTRRAPGLGTI